MLHTYSFVVAHIFLRNLTWENLFIYFCTKIKLRTLCLPVKCCAADLYRRQTFPSLFDVHSVSALSVVSIMCSHTPDSLASIFLQCRFISQAFSICLLSPLFPIPGSHHCTLNSNEISFCNTTYEWTHMAAGWTVVLSMLLQGTGFLHFSLFCMCTLYLYSFIHWWSLRLFAHLDYCGRCGMNPNMQM